MDATILYYSSNKERWEFESRIIKSLLEQCNGLPIIAITQKPINLFDCNIVVGDVGVSGFNMFRQVLLGCKEATSKFIISAEADCVYPPDYFTWEPERDDVCYRNTNLYVMGQHRKYFYYKPTGATHAQVVGREFYIRTLERLFGDGPMWSVEEFNFPKERLRGKQEDVFTKKELQYYRSENPVVQIKTSQSMRNYTFSQREPIYELPYWGRGKEFRRKWYNISTGELH